MIRLKPPVGSMISKVEKLKVEFFVNRINSEEINYRKTLYLVSLKTRNIFCFKSFLELT